MSVLRERLSLVQTTKSEKRLKWDVRKFVGKYQKAQEYQRNLTEKLEVHMGDISIENMWKGIRESITDAASVSTRKEKNDKNSEWFDEECKEATRQKRQHRMKILQKETKVKSEKYRDSRREAKKISMKKKKRIYI